MKSILHQLKKYRQPQLLPTIEVKDDDGNKSQTDLDQLAKQITEEYLSVTITRALLEDFQTSEWTDILYPIEVLAIYHCYCRYGHMVSCEQSIDERLAKFWARQNKNKFRKHLSIALDDISKKIALARSLIATKSDLSFPKKDRLPPNMAPEIAKHLGCSDTNTAQIILEQLIRAATPEQNIIGRMGYMEIWYNYENKRELPILMVTDQPHARR